MKLRFSLLAVASIACLSTIYYLAPRSSLAQLPSPASGQLPKPRVPSCCGGQPITAPREVDFPYYNLTNGWISTLNLVSATSKPLDFTLVVKSKLGQTLITAETIQSRAKLALDMRNLIAELGGDPTGEFSEGSVALHFTGTVMPLVGQITMTNPALSLVNESVMVERDPGRSDVPAVLNGVWWGLAGREGRVMVSNVSGISQSAQVFLDFQGQRHPVPTPLTFLPYETKVLSLTELLTSINVSPAQAPEGGITIIQTGPLPSLIANGRITDAATGFSTTIDFPSPATEYVNSLHANGLPVGTPTHDSPFAGAGSFVPHVIVRNLNDLPETVTVTVEYPQPAPALTTASAQTSPSNSAGGSIPDSAGQEASTSSAGGGKTGSTFRPVSLDEPVSMTPKLHHIHPAPPRPGDANHHPELWGHGAGATVGTVTLGPFPITPYSSVDYSLAAALSQLPLPLPYCSVRIQYSGAPATVQAQVTSVESRGNLVVDSHVVNEGNGWTGSGANPWHLDDNTESIVFLTNESNQPARIGFSVTAGGTTGAEGTHYYLTMLRLNPHETRVIDLRQLRDAQVLDLKNNLIPASATDGSVDWNRIDNVAVMGRLMVVNRKAGLASNYDCCTNYCPNTIVPGSMEVSPSSSNIGVSDGQQYDAEEEYTDQELDQFWWDCTDYTPWSSQYTSVATVNDTALATGVGGGSSNIGTSDTGCQTYYVQYNYGQSCYCAQNTTNAGSSPLNVVSLSQSPTTLYMSTGDTGQITVTVNPSDLPVTLSFSGTGSTTSNPNSSGAVTLTASGSGSGSINTNVTASPAGDSGVFNVTASAGGVTSNNSTGVSVPPQVLIQMMYGEAGGAGSGAQQAVGVAARNRFGNPYFSGDTTYQNTVVSDQFQGINTSITTGVSPELTNAVYVWLGAVGDIVSPSGGPSSACFWTPSSSEWSTISAAVSSGTTSESGIPNDTGCYSGAPYGQQIRVVNAVGTNGSGVPWFVFQGPRSSSSSPVAIEF